MRPLPLNIRKIPDSANRTRSDVTRSPVTRLPAGTGTLCAALLTVGPEAVMGRARSDKGPASNQVSAVPGHVLFFHPDFDVARTAWEFLSQFRLPAE